MGCFGYSLMLASAVVASSVILNPATAADSTSPSPPIGASVPDAGTASAPYTLKLMYTGEIWDNAAGGLNQGSTYIQNADAQFYVNTDQAFGWTGGSFLIEGFYNNSNSLDTQYVGSAQDVSVIDTSGVALARLYQVFYKQALGNTNLLFGIYDLETEFGATKPMDIFFNGAYNWNFALDQSGLTGPSTYPNTAPAFRVRQRIDRQWSVQAAILDGVSDSVNHPAANAVIFNKNYGALAIAEASYVPVRYTKILAGIWGYSGKFDALGETTPNGSPRQTYDSEGAYFGAATRLYGQSPRRGLDGFANIGVADSKTQIISKSFNAGLTYTGILDSRPTDKIGLAIGIAGDGGPYRIAQIEAGQEVEKYETNFELTYRATLASWLTVQPDVQYFINTGLNPALKNDFVFGLHFEIGHAFNF